MRKVDKPIKFDRPSWLKMPRGHPPKDLMLRPAYDQLRKNLDELWKLVQEEKLGYNASKKPAKNALDSYAIHRAMVAGYGDGPDIKISGRAKRDMNKWG